MDGRRRRCRGAGAANPPPLENVKVLSGWDATQVRDEMRRMAEALGVKCDHCHVQGNFASDEKRTKRVGRRMFEMTLALNRGVVHGLHAGRGRVAARPRHLLHLPPGRGDPEELGRRSGAAMSGALTVRLGAMAVVAMLLAAAPAGRRPRRRPSRPSPRARTSPC